jgi:hypothetical protein
MKRSEIRDCFIITKNPDALRFVRATLAFQPPVKACRTPAIWAALPRESVGFTAQSGHP